VPIDLLPKRAILYNIQDFFLTESGNFW
jgi:hypothetical protein